MDIYILRIELIRYEIALRHTAFNIREEIHACFCRCRQREWRKQAEPPPAYFFFFSDLLNALEAADFVLSHRIGRFFLYMVRGPPSHKILFFQSCEKWRYAMWQRNNGQTEAEKLQNRFTAYLLVAVRRQQRDYVIKKNQRIRHEFLMEDDTYQTERQTEADILDELPLLIQMENVALQCALEQISERERYVFMARVLDGISFEELGAELGLGYKGVAAVYYRAVSKIRKRMKEVDQNEF